MNTPTPSLEGGHGWQLTRAGVVYAFHTEVGNGLARMLVQVCEPCLIDIEPSDEPVIANQ